MRSWIARALAVACIAVGCRAQDNGSENVANVAEARFLDARWQPRRMSELGERAAVVVYFATVDCPMVRRYLPRVGAVATDYLPKGVATVIVNVGAGDGFVDAVAQQVEYAPDAIFAKDHLLEVARACGVDRSGAVVVLDRQRRVRYCGRIDDQYGYSVSRDRPQRHDLRAALDQVLANAPVDVARTEVVGCRITPPSATATSAGYNQDVAPIVQRHCLPCHGASSPASFPLTTEEQIRKHAAMIDEVVSFGRMPPWTATSSNGPFLNRRGLSPRERETLHAWINGGLPRGEGPPGPALHVAHPEWSIGQPGIVIDAAELVDVEGEAPLRYHDVVFAHDFAQDTWVEAMEVRSRGGSPLHHANLAVVAPGETYSPEHHVGNQAMHGGPVDFEAGTALRIPAGSKVVAQLLYVANGKSTKEKVQLALRFPRIPIKRDVRVATFGDDSFRIPPGAAAHRVEADWLLPDDAIGVSVFVQMHLRGRDVSVVADTPDGVRQSLLLIPSYLFSGQEAYVWWRGACRWPKGTRFHATAHFDNSSWNAANPDPAAWVQSGSSLADERFRVALTWLPSTESMDLRVDSASGTVIATQPEAEPLREPARKR